jgi:1-acyl-sn-glycerol-3-phosphate acyltransferase
VKKHLRIVFATSSHYTLTYLVTTLGVLLGCLAGLVRWQGFIRVGTTVWGKMLFWLVGRNPHISGRENITPGKSYLVVSNHSSMYDIPALMAAVPGIAIMGRDYLQRIPAFGRLLKMLHFVPINTSSGRSTRAALAMAAQEIRGGTSVGIFPEGTRTPTGRVQNLKRGFVTVLRESGSDLLPVHIRGTYALKPKGKLTMDPREKITVRIGAPVSNADLVRLEDGDIMQKVKTILESMGDEQA